MAAADKEEDGSQTQTHSRNQTDRRITNVTEVKQEEAQPTPEILTPLARQVLTQANVAMSNVESVLKL